MFVESCGALKTNGVDVLRMHREIIHQSRVWIGRVQAVVCHVEGQPIDEAPVGSTFLCDVYDKTGFPNQAKVTVTPDQPHFGVELLFGD